MGSESAIFYGMLPALGYTRTEFLKLRIEIVEIIKKEFAKFQTSGNL